MVLVVVGGGIHVREWAAVFIDQTLERRKKKAGRQRKGLGQRVEEENALLWETLYMVVWGWVALKLF